MLDPTSGVVREFVAKKKVGFNAALYILGGVVFFAVLLVQFLLLILTPAKPGDDLMPGILGGVSVVGVALVLRGVFLLRTTARVVIDPTAIHMGTWLATRSVAWNEIDHIEQDKRSSLMGSETLRVVRLVDSTGRCLAVIDEAIAGFDDLAAEIAARSSRVAGHATFDTTDDEQRRIAREVRKSRRLALGFALFTLAMGAALCAGIHEELHVRRYATDGVRVDAQITQRRMVNVTPHVEYSFRDEAGQTHVRDAMMWVGPEWDKLEQQETVPVEYLRSDPTWNRLVAGEDPGPQFGGKFLLICAGGLIMCGTMFVMTLLGYDLKTENGVTTVSRRGRTIKSWGKRKEDGSCP